MSISPFLKWVGGKRWLVASHKDLFDIKFDRYIEPFAGSASVFFYLNPPQAILSDKNKKLMDAYRAIKKDWQRVVSSLIKHSRNHSTEYYYTVRALAYDDEYDRAAQLIYLNRTCWNGLYRVNKNGQFNVPRGTKDKVILDTDDFEGVSRRLQRTELLDGDFSQVIEMAGKGDLLFVDPPYTANHNKNGFLKYNEKIFSWDDQLRLSNYLNEAHRKGVQIILTNADHETVRQLYEENFKIKTVPRASVLSGKSKYRRKVTELLVLGNLSGK